MEESMIQAIIQGIATLGFPIVACGALFWQNIRQTQMLQEQQQKTQEAIINNTAALTELASALNK